MAQPNKMHETRGAAGMDATTAAQLGLDPTYALEHEELFAFDEGREWFVVHSLLRPSREAGSGA